MTSRFQPQIIQAWRGLNADENPHEVGQGELIIATNVYRRGGAIGTRPGFEREGAGQDYENQIASNTPIQGIVEYRQDNDTTRDLVVVAGGAIHTDDTTTITGALTLSGADNAVWTFAQHSDTLYAAGGLTTNPYWKWTGTGNAAAVSVLDLSAAAIYPSYTFEKWNRVWLAGFRDAAGAIAKDKSSNPMTARYSALNDPDTYPVGDTLGGNSAIGGLSAYGDEYITGFADFVDNEGDWLLVLTNKQLYSVNRTGISTVPFSVPPGRGAIANGCVHQLAYVSLGLDAGDAVYMSDRGIHSVRQSQQYGGEEENFLSWKIRSIFNTINKSQMGLVRGAYNAYQGLVIFAVPTGSNAFNDLILVLDVKNSEELTAQNAIWYVWYLAGSTDDQRAISYLTSARSSSDVRHVYAGNLDGDVFRTSRSTYSDLGTAYPVHIRTRHEDFGLPGGLKNQGDVWLHMQPGGAYKPTYRTIFDFGRKQASPLNITMENSSGAVYGTAVYGTATYGSEVETVREKLYAVGSGETIAHDFQHENANEPFWIAKLAAQVRVFGETEGDT
jgi:hypothetical protein